MPVYDIKIDPTIANSELIPGWVRPYVPIAVNVLIAIIILIIGWVISKWAHRLALTGLRKARVEEALSRFLASAVQYSVLAATVVSSLNQAGIETTSFVAILASAGLAIGLALQGSLASFASGVMILFFRPFTLGDSIKVSNNEGTVEDIGLFQTKLRAACGETIFLPNSTITSNPIINYSSRGVLQAIVTVGVAYGSDLDKVFDILAKVAAEIETALAKPAPSYLLKSLGDSSVEFQIGVWCKNSDYITTQSALRKGIYTKLSKAGIDIPFPQLVLHKAEAGQPITPR